ncbi:hypothetical protein SEPCBS119000_001283 [Sporothrix epigloea]|uniref:ACB domain-containing protein n=1 Tax=Sporothrix epigloea TaxID=1892477 RepID=A0ABP0DDL9_9PEZI
MADSVDRVFVHALNTVKKIPKTGAARPPARERMRLYGLYKQAMEGDVDGVMERPNGYSGLALSVDELRREQDKWDAWNAQRGLGRTEAKRRYIESLIETMHTYATTPTASELVAELEFVWNQIKDNNSPNSSGLLRKETLSGIPASPRQDEYYDTRDYLDRDRDQRHDQRSRAHGRDTAHEQIHRRTSLSLTASDGGPMKILSPMSEEDEVERENRMRLITEELETAASADDDDDFEEEEEENGDEAATARRQRGLTTVHDGSRAGGETSKTKAAAAAAAGRASTAGEPATSRSQRWSKMMERTMVKLTAEIAALREQIQSGRGFQSQRENRTVPWLGWLAWALFKHITVDIFVLAVVLLWMRRRKDRRLEDHVRGALLVIREYIRKILPPR